MTFPLSLISLFFLFINSPLNSAQYLQQAQNWQNPSNGHLAPTYSSSPFDRCCFCCCFCPVPFTQVLQQQQQPFPGDKFPPSQGYGQSQQMVSLNDLLGFDLLGRNYVDNFLGDIQGRHQSGFNPLDLLGRFS